MTSLGRHCLVELYDCPLDRIDDVEHVLRCVREAAIVAGATLLAEQSHRFEPHGVTAVALLAESHISVHTWPEHRYAAVDVFTCGTTTDPAAAGRYLVTALGAVRHELRLVDRGHPHLTTPHRPVAAVPRLEVP